MTEPHVVYLADHSFVLAVPAFAPAVVVAGVVVYLAMRDRRYVAMRDRRKRDDPPHSENAGSPGHGADRDGS
jgi:hypothetical protein